MPFTGTMLPTRSVPTIVHEAPLVVLFTGTSRPGRFEVRRVDDPPRVTGTNLRRQPGHGRHHVFRTRPSRPVEPFAQLTRGQLGLHGAGSERVDGNPARDDLWSERSGKPFHGCL